MSPHPRTHPFTALIGRTQTRLLPGVHAGRAQAPSLASHCRPPGGLLFVDAAPERVSTRDLDRRSHVARKPGARATHRSKGGRRDEESKPEANETRITYRTA